MRPDILIVGQGLAGTLLAWEFERAGIPFVVADRGHATAATAAAAGLINPITGRRLVKSWRVDALLPMARAAYSELEAALGVPLWHDMRVRRLFADDRERQVWHEKQARGELAPFTGAADDAGFWIERAARVDLAALLAATRARWRAQGKLRTDEADVATEGGRHDLVIDCTGNSAYVGLRASACLPAAQTQSTTPISQSDAFDFVPWEFSKGEMLEIAVDGLASDVVINSRHWVAPIAPRSAWVGATHEPGVIDATPTAAARMALEASARRLLARPFTVTGHRVGVRVNLPDRRPIAGRHPNHPRLGLANGLGAKGALVAPMLARQWVNHLTEGVPFDADIDVGRFFARSSSQASAQ